MIIDTTCPRTMNRQKCHQTTLCQTTADTTIYGQAIVIITTYVQTTHITRPASGTSMQAGYEGVHPCRLCRREYKHSQSLSDLATAKADLTKAVMITINSLLLGSECCACQPCKWPESKFPNWKHCKANTIWYLSDPI